MKFKMHLGARVPSEGARRLAQWIAREYGGDLDRAAERLKTTAMRVQRILDGEIVPDLLLQPRVTRASGATNFKFHNPPAGGWFDVIPMRVA